eukprot:GFYU01058062.1.p1 GENE.GFYU01058062.1~~GFYU01058062.1.p1  ORF type:complete len:187 (+),score=44.89 GFYU01058062.1:482-1042(+)
MAMVWRTPLCRRTARVPGMSVQIYMLYLTTSGRVQSYSTIIPGTASFTGTGGSLQCGDALGDVDGDGVVDVVAGARNINRMYVLMLKTEGVVKRYMYIDQTSPSFTYTLTAGNDFAESSALLGNIGTDAVGGGRLQCIGPSVHGAGYLWVGDIGECWLVGWIVVGCVPRVCECGRWCELVVAESGG